MEWAISAIKNSEYPINLLIVDDEALFRRSLRSLVDRIPDIHGKIVIVEASSGEEALILFQQTRFDSVIADVRMGEGKMDGFEFTKEVVARYPGKAILIHSNVDLSDGQERAMESGAVGFMPKPMSQQDLLKFLASNLRQP